MSFMVGRRSNSRSVYVVAADPAADLGAGDPRFGDDLGSVIDNSAFLTPQPGDVIAMGTPAGVGHARKPPVFMEHGDIIEVEIERIGPCRNPVVDEPFNGDASEAAQ